MSKIVLSAKKMPHSGDVVFAIVFALSMLKVASDARHAAVTGMALIALVIALLFLGWRALSARTLPV